MQIIEESSKGLNVKLVVVMPKSLLCVRPEDNVDYIVQSMFCNRNVITSDQRLCLLSFDPQLLLKLHPQFPHNNNKLNAQKSNL
ncbi:CLUMA_CG019353, isoform A [Clunio marinus]|uniref:CLUMA_CG019353, isoform A n=1 Tax=Clunio marinus TaxID=568069 RepID=A0A1J1J131_9DIPT|nr:CLUMA_CG019353, isoform A [Clunio marinus]